MSNIRKKELSKMWLRKIDLLSKIAKFPRCFLSHVHLCSKRKMSINIKLTFKKTRTVDVEKINSL